MNPTLRVLLALSTMNFFMVDVSFISRYSGWKGMLDAELLREPAVKHHLNQALDMMNHAVAGTFQPGARENMAYLISTERRWGVVVS